MILARPATARHVRPALVVALLSGALAFLLVLFATDPLGPGLDPDAMSYLGAAQSLVSTGSYRVPTAAATSPDSTSALAHFPPGFSTAIALPLRLGMAPIQAARLVECVAAFVWVALLAALAVEAAGASASVALALVLVASPALAIVHISVLSEPLFLAFLALTLTAMVRSPDRPLLAGLAAAAAAITRYAGLAFAGAATLWAIARPTGGRWWTRDIPLRTRIARGALALAPTLLLQGAWVLRTRHLTGGHRAIRSFALYGGWGATLAQGRDTLVQWLAPITAPWENPTALDFALAGAVVCGLAALAALAVARARSDEASVARAEVVGAPPRQHDHPPIARSQHQIPADAISTLQSRRAALLLRAVALVALCYLGMIFLSRLVADPAIPLDERILAPFIALAALALVVALARWLRPRGRVVRALTLVIFLAWLGAAGWQSWSEASFSVQEGSDLAGGPWRRSALLAWARDHAAGAPLYSNWPSAIYFQSGRTARFIPAPDDPAAARDFGRVLARTHGMVLAFDVPSPETVSPDSLARALGLVRVARLDDGSVWKAP